VKVTVLTIFPEMFSGFLETSILKRGIARGLIQVELVDFRNFARDKHRRVDDYPYGGGAGMVLKPEPIYEALESLEPERHVVLLSPQGQRLTQARVSELAQKRHLVLVCGHYEGLDERIRSACDEEISIGDYILTGGEVAAMVVIDAVCRLVPGILGSETSAAEDSFSEGLLEYPQYTRPPVWRNQAVPEILLSGDHQKIKRWRHWQSLLRTREKRPDLFSQRELTDEEIKLLLNGVE